MSPQKTLEEIWKIYPCKGADIYWAGFWSESKRNGFVLTDIRIFLNTKTNNTFHPESVKLQNPKIKEETEEKILATISKEQIIIEPKEFNLIGVSKRPLVSIIIPTYNRKNMVTTAIDSALNQSYINIEVIIIDDGSTDGTDDIIQEKYKNNTKVKYLWKANGGVGSALNAGIKMSNGELIAWLSSDDFYDLENNKLIELSVKEHIKNKNVGLTYTDYRVHWIDAGNVSETTSVLPKTRQEQLDEIIRVCYINGSTTVIKKEVFYTIGMFNENLKYAQDHEMWMRIVGHYKIQNIHGFLLNYSQGKHQRDGGECAHGCRIESEISRERSRLLFEKNRPVVCAMICMKDEEALVEQCLSDLIFYVDKIVIFDDGSTDKTPELIKKYPKVIDYFYSPNKGNVRTEGKDRQELLKMAQKTKSDWILFIDPD